MTRDHTAVFILELLCFDAINWNDGKVKFFMNIFTD